MTPPLITPQQGNITSQGFQQNVPLSHPMGPTSSQEPSYLVQQSPVIPRGQLRERPNQEVEYIAEQMVRTSTPPNQQYSSVKTAFEPLQWGLGALPDTPVSVESLEATSKAAQHWRQSWLDRQHDEAGPAVGVSRGQALVPEPLLAMQNSFARMRAIILPKSGDNNKNSGLRSKFPIVLLIFLIGVLVVYLLSTYSSGLLGTKLVSLSANTDPTLTMKTTKTTTAAKTIIVAAGQAIQVHGEHFGANDTIVFFLDDMQLHGTSGKPVSTQSNNQGTFDASLSIPATQLAGEYVVQAQDNHTRQHAFLNIQTTTSAVTNVLKLSTPSLAFASFTGRGNPHEQIVNITNTSNTAIQWSAVAISDNQAGWLLLRNGKTSGQLEPGQTDKIHVSVFTEGLISSLPPHPYTGKIVFTIVNQGQVTLPVKLALTEVVV